jgi:transposase
VRAWSDAKKKTLHAAEQDRPDVAEKRKQWRAEQPGLDPRGLIFIDETWIKTNMVRSHGRAPRGDRLIDKSPHGHWKTSTLIAGLRMGGVVAPAVFDGAINGDLFTAWVEQVLTPELRPGDVVILDNLSSHKSATARALIEAADASMRFLPAYSPDLNPIEMLFAKLKSLLRTAAARTVEGLWNTIGRLVRNVAGGECENYLRHAGYFQSA